MRVVDRIVDGFEFLQQFLGILHWVDKVWFRRNRYAIFEKWGTPWCLKRCHVHGFTFGAHWLLLVAKNFAILIDCVGKNIYVYIYKSVLIKPIGNVTQQIRLLVNIS